VASAWRVVVTCEHAGNDIPARYASLFQSHIALAALASHRGWDPGSLTVGRRLSKAFDAPLLVNSVSRLLIEVNRSMHHPKLYSEFSRALTGIERRRVVSSIYSAHRDRIEQTLRRALRRGRCVLHIASHSFTPELDGEQRNADVGLLYDPHFVREKALCLAWQKSLRQMGPAYRVRRNYPYLGSAGGLTTHLRKVLKTPRYLGIELEVNQRFVLSENLREWRRLQGTLVESLQVATGSV
jgi:predicted N-formylglutamate amidohydrolase